MKSLWAVECKPNESSNITSVIYDWDNHCFAIYQSKKEAMENKMRLYVQYKTHYKECGVKSIPFKMFKVVQYLQVEKEDVAKKSKGKAPDMIMVEEIPTISIFSKYKVDYESKFSYQNEDGDWVEGKDKWQRTLDGGGLLDSIMGLVRDKDFVAMRVKPEEIKIEHFDPMTGQTADYKIKIKEIRDEKAN